MQSFGSSGERRFVLKFFYYYFMHPANPLNAHVSDADALSHMKIQRVSYHKLRPKTHYLREWENGLASKNLAA